MTTFAENSKTNGQSIQTTLRKLLVGSKLNTLLRKCDACFIPALEPFTVSRFVSFPLLATLRRCLPSCVPWIASHILQTRYPLCSTYQIIISFKTPLALYIHYNRGVFNGAVKQNVMRDRRAMSNASPASPRLLCVFRVS